MRPPEPPIHPDVFAGLVPLGSLGMTNRLRLSQNAAWVCRQAGEFLLRAGDVLDTALFLFEGQIELCDAARTEPRRIEAGTETARFRIPVTTVAGVDVKCLTPVRCLAVNARMIDMLLTWEQGVERPEPAPTGEAVESDDWMMRLLQIPAFQLIPPVQLQAMFMRMQTVTAQPGQVIVRQGEPGDYFYVITQGRCVVTREVPSQRPLQLAQLDVGSCFGEEALISDSPRNATVTMLTQGVLRQLAKQDFEQLVNQPLARSMPWAEAEDLVARNKARFLDVRLPSEYRANNIPGSIGLPLYLLRQRVGQLDSELVYVCVCDTGRRSSVASFLLLQRGIDAYTLDGGLPVPN